MSGFAGRDAIPRVTVRWPRQIGGPRHGEPRAPDPSPEVIHYATLPDGSFVPGDDVPRAPRVADPLTYVAPSLSPQHPNERNTLSTRSQMPEITPMSPAKAGLYIVLAIIVFLTLCVGGVAGCKSFNRYQKRADATNSVQVTAINIRKAQQQAKIVAAQDATVMAQADQRLIKARGIKRAQDEIQSTLTPLYVQFEAIEAQKAVATSGRNNTIIYVPSGTNGTPVITQPSKPNGGNTP